jgi:hypothetical protein
MKTLEKRAKKLLVFLMPKIRKVNIKNEIKKLKKVSKKC